MSKKKKQEESGQTLKNRLNEELLNKLNTKKSEWKQQEAAEKEQARLKKIEERKQREANKTFEELLEENELDWKKFK